MAVKWWGGMNDFPVLIPFFRKFVRQFRRPKIFVSPDRTELFPVFMTGGNASLVEVFTMANNKKKIEMSMARH